MDAAVTAPKLMQQKAIVMPMARGPNLPATQRKAVLSGIVMRKNIPIPSETIPPVSYDLLMPIAAEPRNRFYWRAATEAKLDFPHFTT
jgi:hypothetical protein